MATKQAKPQLMFYFLEWLVKITGYSLVLITVSVIFADTIYIDNSYYGIWALLATIIIFVLNKTIKPLLVWLTLPLTALTLGLFYPIINVIILNIVDIFLGEHFKLQGVLMSIIVALMISIMNFLLNELVIRRIIGGIYE